MMKDQLKSPAFAPKAFGDAVTVEAPECMRGEGESNPTQSGSHRVAASRSDLFTASQSVAVKSVLCWRGVGESDDLSTE